MRAVFSVLTAVVWRWWRPALGDPIGGSSNVAVTDELNVPKSFSKSIIRYLAPSVSCISTRKLQGFKSVISEVAHHKKFLNMSASRRCSEFKQTNGQHANMPFIIGVAGGTASGKSTVCKRIMEKLGQEDIDHANRRVVCISQDSFYRDLSPAESEAARRGQVNFDHPDQFDDRLMLDTLRDIRDGKPCHVPIYDYNTNSRLPESRKIYPADVVLCEGILVFYQPQVRDMFDMKLFVDTDADTRLSRRVRRDTQERGRDLDTVLDQYTKLVKPAFEEFCLPTKKFADVIIPRGADNTVAMDLIVQSIRDRLLTGGARGEAGGASTGRRRNVSDSQLYNYTPH